LVPNFDDDQRRVVSILFQQSSTIEQYLKKRKTSYPNLATSLVERDGRGHADGEWEAGHTSNPAEHRDPTEFQEKIAREQGRGEQNVRTLTAHPREFSIPISATRQYASKHKRSAPPYPCKKKRATPAAIRTDTPLG
jgi:hypothetical protein